MKRQILPDPQAVARAAALQAVVDLRMAIETYGNATWVIAGGSTLMLAYQVLATIAVDALDWSKVTIIIGDERVVPLEDLESNWGQAGRVLFDRLPLSPQSLPPTAERGVVDAESYERHLLTLPRNDTGLPRLDLVWLGMGPDGHTLSIFPNHPSMESASADALVIRVDDSPKPPPQRISLSFLALTAAERCVVLVAGEAKAPAIAHVAQADLALPIVRATGLIEKSGGEVLWLIDAAAASQTPA